jgi:hypothetical protein
MHAFSAHEIKLLRLGTRYNNNKPRDPVTFRKEDSEEYKQKIETLGGIHHNGIESFPLFATAVVSAVDLLLLCLLHPLSLSIVLIP